MNTGARLTRQEYDELTGLLTPVDHVRLYVEGTFDGHRVRFCVECAPEADIEARAVRWLERQARINHLDGQMRREEVVTYDSRGKSWEERGGEALE